MFLSIYALDKGYEIISMKDKSRDSTRRIQCVSTLCIILRCFLLKIYQTFVVNIMSQNLSSSSAKELLSVAIEIGKTTHLCKLNQSFTLSEIIQELCLDLKLPYQEGQYAFTLNIDKCSTYRYVDETNRKEVKDGSMLKLVFSPSEMAKVIVNKVTNRPEGESYPDGEGMWALERLQGLAVDPIFARHFFEMDGIKIILDLIMDVKLPVPQLNNCLATLNSMMEHKIVKTLEDAIVKRITQFLVNASGPDTIVPSLAIAEKLVSIGCYEYINKTIGMSELIQLLCNEENVEIQKNVLALMIAMGRSKNKKILQSMASKQTKEIIEKEFFGNDETTAIVAKELYEYQSLVLSLREKKLNTEIDPSGSDSAGVIELCNVVVKEDVNRHSVGSLLGDHKTTPYELESKASSLQDCSVPLPAKLRNDKSFSRSKSTVVTNRPTTDIVVARQPRSVTLDFSRTDLVTPISRLALDCMLYFARRYPKEYVRMLLAEEASWQPFPTTCQRITKLVCDVLGVKKSKASIKKYQPLMFKEGAFLEEVFCRILLQLGKTRRDMKARTRADQEKVIWVLQRQLRETLTKQPTSLKNLTMKLRDFNYATISEIMHEEMKAKEDGNIKSLPTILEFRESRKESIMSLIRQQRMSILLQGTSFPKFSLRNNKLKNRTSFVMLSSNQRSLHYYDRDEDGRNVIDSSGKISIADISAVLVGKKCPHVKEAKIFKPEYDLAFSLVCGLDQGSSYDLMAPDQVTLDYWLDAINILTGKDMKSNTMEEELKGLLEMEVRLQLLDIDLSDIPTEPPIIPREPPNYDFQVNI